MPSFSKGSYTEYSNKIGLYSNNQESFISQSPDVVLNFPYKDCVLEGGMTKEDAKRDERFLNVKLDKRDIDTLFDPKVLTNFKYIDSNGERELSANDDIDFFDKNGELKQNLLIKGNNLVALHTLREKLAGKVKLIYIDPPYNTGNDGFKYNDSFNHSSWLVFMKNRLEIARTLLASDGAIFISIDEHEEAYLKILMDEIFGCDNFVNNICVRRGAKSLNSQFSDIKSLNVGFEYVLVYRKSSRFSYVNPYLREANEKQRNGLWAGLYSNVDRPTMRYEIDGVNIDHGQWKWSKEKGLRALANYKTYQRNESDISLKDYYLKKRNEGEDLDFVRKNTNGTIEYWVKPRDRIIVDPNFMDLQTSGNSDIKRLNLLSDDLCDTPKPESLIYRIIELATHKGDIVLDFCLGSGTTAAVAHKMKRHWIGIEQMSYITAEDRERLKKVIAGEQGGISKSVNWQGGGSFVYMELKKYNQEYVDQINAATNMTELEEVYKKMYQNAFLKFWFDKKTFERDERFRSMDLNTRKQALIGILDENQLYLNYADMDDAKYHVSDNERALTKRFYGDDSDDSNDTEAEE